MQLSKKGERGREGRKDNTKTLSTASEKLRGVQKRYVSKEEARRGRKIKVCVGCKRKQNRNVPLSSKTNAVSTACDA